MKETEINFAIDLDENHIPEKIIWAAPDGGVVGQETKSILLSVWDHKTKEALRIDLWTKEMPVDEMKRFIHQVFISLGDTYQKATDEEDVAEEIRKFAEYFADRSGIKM
ncbi:gliding motility protein GldC [Apibacter muscae]|uniref:Gliding motility protein GldC n=1 Tax=Apibacter muscae TaxID=2509004 RepID=A0A563DFK5_9FLAO|nr:gliding motility protein GldC [Apibacter muscae]TWP23695.1 gliding motility protein GldC [Apibacter muscae]TWP28980.1 gliding motility protein GldC [Apibacter muscae]TWP30445.1 gliding motility protein GldC [Apibacter muscae]